MPNLTILSLLFLRKVKYSLSRLNSQTMLMTSICWLPNSIHLIRPAPSLVLSQRHTTVATSYYTLLPSFTRMSKRGSRVLRYALVNAVWNVARNNTTFKAYYDSKRAEGRSHYNALGHCAGKLVRVIWKMLTDKVEFNLE